MPTKASQRGQARWKVDSRSCDCSGRSHGQGYPHTTPSPNRKPGLRNTSLNSRAEPLPALTRPRCELRHSWNGIPPCSATAASSSTSSICATAQMGRRAAMKGRSSMNRPPKDCELVVTMHTQVGRNGGGLA